ncbi:hypothetical protein U9M48_020788 [Paspalum notatum var. saurae]|uniref:Ubiquinol oxidase n=1 Tax=Paspalum notatum var. saurae TaxID=547442 RepID=A0AAQ3TFU8_PASNO
MVKSLIDLTRHHLRSLHRFEHSGGWIPVLLEEVENERMHLMTFMEVAKPKWYEHALVLAVQGVFFNAYFMGTSSPPSSRIASSATSRRRPSIPISQGPRGRQARERPRARYCHRLLLTRRSRMGVVVCADEANHRGHLGSRGYFDPKSLC